MAGRDMARLKLFSFPCIILNNDYQTTIIIKLKSYIHGIKYINETINIYALLIL
jgi:hypothetical protein